MAHVRLDYRSKRCYLGLSTHFDSIELLKLHPICQKHQAKMRGVVEQFIYP